MFKTKNKTLNKKILATIVNSQKNLGLTTLTNNSIEIFLQQVSSCNLKQQVLPPITEKLHVIFHKPNGDILSIEKF